jgi:hypothetical protein
VNTENGWIVVLVIIGIVILFNLAMFVQAFSSRGRNSDWLKNMRGSLDQPFKKEDDSLDELHKRVEELQSSDKKARQQKSTGDTPTGTSKQG